MLQQLFPPTPHLPRARGLKDGLWNAARAGKARRQPISRGRVSEAGDDWIMRPVTSASLLYCFVYSAASCHMGRARGGSQQQHGHGLYRHRERERETETFTLLASPELLKQPRQRPKVMAHHLFTHY
ncbi:hypothetical protein chiPu_0010809 [Chiloscyllium punctatum]|uniref:Uncharacterized protein n=1 Tax=Chiloscyllium punctatum TaxID=137246 RepID=A0A401SPQ0_CHIPU|nr:hypothetical protein [Chiloscyllium punctatum]